MNLGIGGLIQMIFFDYFIEKMCVYFGLEKIEEVGRINIYFYLIG